MDKKSGGFTLIELIVVIAILGFLAAVAVPRLAGFRSMAVERVCAVNQKTVGSVYSVFLVEDDIDHEESMFDQFVIDNFDGVVCMKMEVKAMEMSHLEMRFLGCDNVIKAKR